MLPLTCIYGVYATVFYTVSVAHFFFILIQALLGLPEFQSQNTGDFFTVVPCPQVCCVSYK